MNILNFGTKDIEKTLEIARDFYVGKIKFEDTPPFITNMYFVGAGLCVDFSFNGERDSMTFSHRQESVGFFSGGFRTLMSIKSCKLLEEIMVTLNINHKTKWL